MVVHAVRVRVVPLHRRLHAHAMVRVHAASVRVVHLRSSTRGDRGWDDQIGRRGRVTVGRR